MPFRTNGGGFPLGRFGCAALVLWSFLLLSGFYLASTLRPDPRGFGTHQALGLPPCSIQMMFDIRCPSCGMTTSFAHFVRGEFLDSVRTNAGGFLLALVCAVQVPWCWWSAARWRLAGVESPALALVWLGIGVSLVTVLQWGARWLIPY